MQNSSPNTNNLCVVDVEAQTMEVILSSGFKRKYPVSTSRFGIGNISGSFKTPLGEHEVFDKFGDHLPLYSIFTSTGKPKATGKIYPKAELNVEKKEDLVLTRVFRLTGLETGINAGENEEHACVDSLKREIWIHGTNREDLVEKHVPGSIGCIRMINQDIEELYPQLEIGTRVSIRRNALSLLV